MSRKRWYWLLVIPAVVPLLVPLYDRVGPTVYGFPFYYWGQLAFVALAMLTMTVVRVLTRRR
ncbi:MAG: hypothetical protein AUI14_10645 [Actinobacteria bacterium 13_2_20CM_2_71_6]|nr:MAG: hypothetical protein AUI14_10645 [Actinobacteria bacterium 13_2_20CM_2_71_6]